MSFLRIFMRSVKSGLYLGDSYQAGLMPRPAQCLQESVIGSTLKGNSMPAFIESLESRQLLSGNPLGIKAPPETIAADQAAIIAAKATIPSDKAAWRAQLRIDHANIPAVAASGRASVRAAQQAIRDARGNPVLLETARGELLLAKANDKTALTTAKAQVKADAGQQKIVLAADKRALTQAKLKLREDRIAR
jgi:hypothetical protein